MDMSILDIKLNVLLYCGSGTDMKAVMPDIEVTLDDRGKYDWRCY